ncbi:YceD family protein [Lactovum odontotermitis]
MKWQIDEIQKQKSIDFSEVLDLKSELMARNPEILDLTEVAVTGSINYDDGFYDLSANADYIITLPSSRSLEPVRLPVELEISESYAPPDKADEVDESTFYSLETDEISLDEVVADNILLEIPLQILTDEEKESGTMPHGKNWQVLSEEDYEQLKAGQKKANSPFAALDGLTTKID